MRLCVCIWFGFIFDYFNYSVQNSKNQINNNNNQVKQSNKYLPKVFADEPNDEVDGIMIDFVWDKLAGCWINMLPAEATFKLDGFSWMPDVLCWLVMFSWLFDSGFTADGWMFCAWWLDSWAACCAESSCHIEIH